MKKKSETIIIFSAHSDDFIIGAGGTIAKYAKEGKKIISIVFSYGERTHPWLKKKVAQKMRLEEALKAGKVVNCKVYFFDLNEGNFKEEFKKIEKKVANLIEATNPTKIFTHSIEDPHPDHKATYGITLDLYKKIKSKQKPEVYIYSIWNPVSFKTEFPTLYVDVTETFSRKMKALKCFPSQKFLAVYPLMTLIIYRAIKNGLKIRKRFAESFFRIK